MYRYPRSYSNTNFVYIICTRKLVTMNKKKKDFAIDAWEECPPSVYNDFFFIAIERLYQFMPFEGNFDNICILIYYKFEFYLLYYTYFNSPWYRTRKW